MALSRLARVGLTATAGLVCAAVLVVFLGRLHLARPGYPLTARFRYVDSLRVAAPVLYGGGVKIGEVEELAIEEGRVAVRMNIFKAARIPQGSEITIHTSGILGEKYVQVEAGDPARGWLEAGSVLEGTDPGSLDRALQRLEALVDLLEPLMKDPQSRKSLGGIMQGMNRLVEDLQGVVTENRGDLREGVANLKALSGDLRQRTAEMKPLMASARRMLNDANARKVNESLESLDDSLRRLERLLKRMEEKKGTLGMLLYDDETGEDLRQLLKDLKRHPWKLLWKK